MRSPPNTACGLRLDTAAICSPDSSSINVVTTLVVPMSMARPNLWSAVSPGSMATTRLPNVVTVTSASRSRSVAGKVLSSAGGTASTRSPVAASKASRSEVCRCSSLGSATWTTRLRMPASIEIGVGAPSGRSPPRIWKVVSSSGGATCTVTGSVTGHWHERRYPSRTSASPSCSSSMIVGGGTVPVTSFTRHEVQRPRPPQVAVMSTPPPCAAFRMVVPGSTART